ncbi:hypothetical protein [Acinetobacter soli]|uniref:hypothetical protein n=1 Tax=Acinetobacter soli TaxID=487316 RepID=UPI001230441F|nr:hypothetical protein [Acinetobacter soli]WOQ35696.1 hypothetical protein R3L12_08895 [Acinetobacter soli]
MKEFIKKHKALSWILGILGTLIVGGLGSGVWEIVLKPLLSFVGNGFINFLINKSTNFSNEIYQSISMRSLDRFQAKIYSLMVMFLATFSIFICLIAFSQGKKKFELVKEDIKQVDKQWIFKDRKNFYCFITIYFLLASVPFVTYTYDGMKTEFISKKVIYFEYLLKVNADVINDTDLKKIESQFAQIKSSEDYIKIIKKLENLAFVNNKNTNKNPL